MANKLQGKDAAILKGSPQAIAPAAQAMRAQGPAALGLNSPAPAMKMAPAAPAVSPMTFKMPDAPKPPSMSRGDRS